MEQELIYKDFSSISPSARWLLLMKGYTGIPFAREAAELLEHPNPFVPDFKKRDSIFWASTYHFESRYLSVNNLLKDLSIRNILELSSGYSFRCLEFAMREGVHYIDTDLPELITAKKEFLKKLVKDESAIKGKLELLPLNVVDSQDFHEITGHFSNGEVTIINEGLFTYLNKNEQEKLCSNIHEVLTRRGGCWINADIYLKNKQPQLGFHSDERVKKFYEQHNTESNSFESFDEAESYFRKMGFFVEKESVVRSSELSSLKYLLRNIPFRQLLKYRKAGKIQATWRLRAIS